MKNRSPFRYFKTSPEVIRLAVMLYVRFPLSLRNVEDLLHERGIDVSHETIRFWWNRFGPMFAKSADLGIQVTCTESAWRCGRKKSRRWGGVINRGLVGDVRQTFSNTVTRGPRLPQEIAKYL